MNVDALIGCLAWYVNSLVNLPVLADMHRISEVHFKVEGSCTRKQYSLWCYYTTPWLPIRYGINFTNLDCSLLITNLASPTNYGYILIAHRNPYIFHNYTDKKLYHIHTTSSPFLEYKLTCMFTSFVYSVNYLLCLLTTDLVYSVNYLVCLLTTGLVYSVNYLVCLLITTRSNQVGECTAD